MNIFVFMLICLILGLLLGKLYQKRPTSISLIEEKLSIKSPIYLATSFLIGVLSCILILIFVSLLNNIIFDIHLENIQIIVDKLGNLIVPFLILAISIIIECITFFIKMNQSKHRSLIKKIGQIIIIIFALIVGIIIDFTVSSFSTGSFISKISLSAIIAIWLTANELLSALENSVSMGAPIPPSLLKLLEKLKRTDMK